MCEQALEFSLAEVFEFRPVFPEYHRDILRHDFLLRVSGHAQFRFQSGREKEAGHWVVDQSAESPQVEKCKPARSPAD